MATAWRGGWITVLRENETEHSTTQSLKNVSSLCIWMFHVLGKHLVKWMGRSKALRNHRKCKAQRLCYKLYTLRFPELQKCETTHLDGTVCQVCLHVSVWTYFDMCVSYDWHNTPGACWRKVFELLMRWMESNPIISILMLFRFIPIRVGELPRATRPKVQVYLT